MTYGNVITDRFENINFDRLRRERVERARAKLIEHGLGAVLCHHYANVRYLTGFAVPEFSRVEDYIWCVLPRTGDPILWVNGWLADTLKTQMPWMEGRIRPRPQVIPAWEWEVFGKSTGSFEKDIMDVLYEAGVKNEPLGLDYYGNLFFLQETFKNVGLKVTDGKRAMLEARAIKTKDEIGLVRIACANE
jgi:Xaa-Pro aminopeptidase